LAQEKREAKRVLQYNEHLKFPVYHTKDELAVVLRDAYESNGAAMYSTAMQVEIVRTQINVRKFVYGAVLEKGRLMSKLKPMPTSPIPIHMPYPTHTSPIPIP